MGITQLTARLPLKYWGANRSSCWPGSCRAYDPHPDTSHENRLKHTPVASALGMLTVMVMSMAATAA